MWIKVGVVLDFPFTQNLNRFRQGGDAIWGNVTFAPDDISENNHTHGELIAFREAVAEGDASLANMTSDAAGSWILERTPVHFQVREYYYLVCCYPETSFHLSV